MKVRNVKKTKEVIVMLKINYKGYEIRSRNVVRTLNEIIKIDNNRR